MTFQKGHKTLVTHGLRRSLEYRAWAHAKQRCTNPNHVGWHLYGGRGIRMCDRWLNDFAAFYADMGPKPTPKHSLDRINPNGPYAPDNCRWASDREQVRNSRATKCSEEVAAKIRASTLSHKAAAAHFGLSYHTIWDIRHGRSWKE